MHSVNWGNVGNHPVCKSNQTLFELFLMGLMKLFDNFLNNWSQNVLISITTAIITRFVSYKYCMLLQNISSYRWTDHNNRIALIMSRISCFATIY